MCLSLVIFFSSIVSISIRLLFTEVALMDLFKIDTCEYIIDTVSYHAQLMSNTTENNMLNEPISYKEVINRLLIILNRISQVE